MFLWFHFADYVLISVSTLDRNIKYIMYTVLQLIVHLLEM